MIEANTETSSAREIEIKFRIGNRIRTLSYQAAFAFGHELLRQRRIDLAIGVFKRLCSVPNHGPRSFIMLAVCLSAKSDYAGARRVLDQGFPDANNLVAATVHDIIVNVRMGFRDDARNELIQLAAEHKEFPSLCLWLGDLFAEAQQLNDARKYWKLAAQRDPDDGSVALSAYQLLATLAANS